MPFEFLINSCKPLEIIVATAALVFYKCAHHGKRADCGDGFVHRRKKICTHTSKNGWPLGFRFDYDYQINDFCKGYRARLADLCSQPCL